MKDDIERVEYASMLYDFYGSLLNESQNEVMALYHEDNLSLSEIAEELGQTRQAVHYTLRKAEKALKSYEEKLSLVSSYKKNRQLAQKVFSIIDSAGIEEPYAEKIKQIIEQITD
ncbi:MAG: MarR family transcriptional regulator [Mogibacterium sp.]|nr:MarR family transcriptional regulator [Mogibacterium sp.]